MSLLESVDQPLPQHEGEEAVVVVVDAVATENQPEGDAIDRLEAIARLGSPSPQLLDSSASESHAENPDQHEYGEDPSVEHDSSPYDDDGALVESDMTFPSFTEASAEASAEFFIKSALAGVIPENETEEAPANTADQALALELFDLINHEHLWTISGLQSQMYVIKHSDSTFMQMHLDPRVSYHAHNLPFSGWRALSTLNLPFFVLSFMSSFADHVVSSCLFDDQPR